MKNNSVTKQMKSPVHPGRIINDNYLVPLKMNIVTLANTMGVSKQTLKSVINESECINQELAVRLAHVFNTTPDLWIGMQANYDLVH